MTTDTDIITGVTGMLRRKRSNEGILLCITFVLVAISPTLEAFPIIQTKHRCSALVVRHQQQLPQPNKQESLSIAADEPQFIIRGSPDDELSDQMWEDIQAGAPPKWLILKEVRYFHSILFTLFDCSPLLLLDTHWDSNSPALYTLSLYIHSYLESMPLPMSWQDSLSFSYRSMHS